jgi:aryl-alcohol dehydrogenase-like predicted oxidoreductase
MHHVHNPHGGFVKRSNNFTRRRFVKTVIGGAALAGVARKLTPLEAMADEVAQREGMPLRPLGRTGHQVRIFSLGGQATLEEANRDEDAAAIINRAIDLGVNYIDTARVYGKGVSETYIGNVMKSRRKEVFLASKTRDRSYDGSMRSLEESLKALQTDKLDLWQLHNVRTQEDLDEIFGKNGAIRALERARDEKFVRFLGITGHKDPFILKKGIEQYPFDSILMALNAADRHKASFIENVLPVAVEKKMSIVGMKIPARGKIFREGGITTMKQAMSYVLTLPVSTIIVGISTVKELEEDIQNAKEFHPLKPEEMQNLENLTKPYFTDASFFKESW